MDNKPSNDLAQLRRQRVKLRRIGVGALLVGGLFALGSCEELTRRGGASPAPAATSQTPLLNPALAGRTAFKQRS